jgi:UDP-N-acetylenolpyruvoylglucosamine reductase
VFSASGKARRVEAAWYRDFFSGLLKQRFPTVSSRAPNLIVHVDKATAADTDKLIADLRRAVRSTGASTGGPGPESKGVHGFPIR